MLGPSTCINNIHKIPVLPTSHPSATPPHRPTTTQAEMAKDAEAQRAACRALVDEAVNRNSRFVDATLQLSNLPVLLGYLLGGSSSGSSSGGTALPVASRWDAEVVAGGHEQLGKQVRYLVAAFSRHTLATCAHLICYAVGHAHINLLTATCLVQVAVSRFMYA